MSLRGPVCLLIGGLLTMGAVAAADEPLMDWSPWQRYRSTVQHPAGYINARDLANARANIERYQWARQFADNAEAQVTPHLERFTPEFLEQMLPVNSVQRCYQCPACRDQDLPRHPGGAWTWSVDDPEVIKCKLCGTVFPNDEYPETIVLTCKSEAGAGQSFSYYGGDTFRQWGYPHCRPSFTGMVRFFKVSWCKNMAYRLALAYALTEKPEYAEVVRKLLLRFAQVYPSWLLVSNYGEIADLDPHVAGLCLDDLPEDELVYPPNQPDRKLYAGYWATGRVGGGGMEGASFTRPVLQAYEFTCDAAQPDGTPLYTDRERIKIERDLILESCVHLIGEKRINNKSVGNRIAVGMVGIALAHPGLVRFGLEGWRLTVDEWFLADGCTPESPAYALMSLGGIYPFPQAVRGYSDPPGYTDDQGERIEDLSLYQGRYGLVWQRMLQGLQGDLRYPPYADSYRTSSIGARFAELLAANYPDQPQYLALLKAHAGDDLTAGHAETALFFREPGLEQRPAPALHFEDDLFPVLCLGQVRTGEHGRRSLALLSATHWGGHHHLDSLNLYYWKDGHELLTDLGYLWDHPMAGMTRRTFAHNTGMVDLKGQKGAGRGGRFHLFHLGERVKVMEASSQAYDGADLYRRTVVQVDHAPENSYLVDLFRLRADASRDLVYHGPGSDCELAGISLREGDLAGEGKPLRFGLRFHLTGLTDEVFVDDVSIRLQDGAELAVNPSAAELDAQTGKPVGWNHYSGDGSAEWGAASPGREDQHCARIKITGQGGNVNQALIHGDTDGYTGPDALQMPDGGSGKVTFWIRGQAARCNIGLVVWRTDPTSAADRDHLGLAAVPVTEQWTQHALDFDLARALDLENLRSAHSPDAWSITWSMADDLLFSAHHCGQDGELVYLGDGWGQRDHRNTDLGATIPYLVRRHRPAQGVSAFLTVFEAHPPGAALVASAARLPVPAEHADNAAALRIDTSLGTDIVVSQLSPVEIVLQTPLGELSTDAAVAVICLAGGKVTHAAMAEGTRLALDDAALTPEVLAVSPALAQQVSEQDAE